MGAATVPIPTELVPPGAPPVRVTLVLLPAGPAAGTPSAPLPPPAAPAPGGWPEGEPTWEDAAWQ